MNWILLTLIAIFSRALMSIAVKTYSTNFHVSQVTQAILFTFVGGIFSLLVSPFIGGVSFEGVSLDLWWVVLIMIVGQAFGNIFFLRGMASLDAGATQIAFSSILIWGALLSIMFLDSQFTLVQFIGMVLLIASIAYLQNGTKKIQFSGILYVIISTAFFAVFQVASAELSKVMAPATYLLLAYFGASILTVLIYFNQFKNDWMVLLGDVKAVYSRLALAAGLSTTFFLFSYLAFQSAPDKGVVIVLLPVQVVISVILGVIILGEKDAIAKKLIASVVAFIAGILILI